MMRSPGWCARVFGFGVQRSKRFLDELRRCVVQPEQQVCWWQKVIWSIFPQSFTGGITLAPVLASASGVLETDGFCVCDAAQSFLGLGKGTQVLYSTSNKRSTLCDPDNTFHANAFSGRFSFLKEHTCWPKKNTTFHSRTLVFARPPIPAPFTCCPMPPRSGLMNLFATFSK